MEPSASSRCSSVCSRKGTTRKMPVELTSTSTEPKRSTAKPTRAKACSRVVMEPAWIATRSPAGSSSARAASSLSRRVPLSTTAAPSSRKRRAAALPMPPPPPVIRTTLFSNCRMGDLRVQIGAGASKIHAHASDASAAILTSVAPLDPEQLAAWRAFLNAHAHVTRAIGRDLAAAGLPDLGWYDLLWTLYRAPERRLRVNELAREVVLSPTAMSRFVDRAEAAGVVRRGPDQAGRRALQVALTDDGVALLRRMWPVYEQGIERHFAAQLDRSPQRLSAMLERIAASAREG